MSYPDTDNYDVEELQFNEDITACDVASPYQYQCPQCGSSNTHAPAVLTNGRQGYWCGDCYYTFGRD